MSFKKAALLLIALLQVAVFGVMIGGTFKFDFEPMHFLYIEIGFIGAVLASALLFGLFYGVIKLALFLGPMLYVIETVALIVATIYVCAAIDDVVIDVAAIVASVIMSIGLFPILCKKK